MFQYQPHNDIWKEVGVFWKRSKPSSDVPHCRCNFNSQVSIYFLHNSGNLLHGISCDDLIVHLPGTHLHNRFSERDWKQMQMFSSNFKAYKILPDWRLKHKTTILWHLLTVCSLYTFSYTNSIYVYENYTHEHSRRFPLSRTICSPN